MNDLGNYAPLLYIPANRPGLENFLFSGKAERIHAVAICLEDAVRPEDRQEALSGIGSWLHRLGQTPSPQCYIRPGDEELLEELLETPGIQGIAGFIIPKATPEKLQSWAKHTQQRFPLMPILESRHVLDSGGRKELAAACADFRSSIPKVRIGANDLLSLLGGLRRPRGKTIYETPMGRVIDELIEVFSGVGLPLSGCVFDRLDDVETLARECRDDVARGLFSKSALNPLQVAVISESYLPDTWEIEEAARILESDSPAVFALNGSMHEPSCHSSWAQRLLRRAAAFGLTVGHLHAGTTNAGPSASQG